MKSWEFMTDRTIQTPYQPPDNAPERREEKAKIDLGRAHAEWQEIVVGTQLRKRELAIKAQELEIKKQEFALKKNELKDRDHETVRAMADRTKKRGKMI
jgi:hypothetical protein